MSEFKEYHNANHHDGDNTFDDQTYKMTNGEDFDDQFVQDCFDHFKAGQQSQQAKIDELKMSNHHLAVQLNDAGDFYDYEKKRADELQKRIDELNTWCVRGVECNMLSTEYNQALIDMIKILKGNKDEN